MNEPAPPSPETMAQEAVCAASELRAAADGTSSSRPPDADTAPPIDLGQEPWCIWTTNDRWFFGTLAAVLLVTLGGYALRKSGWGLRPPQIDRPADRVDEFRVDVNSGTWVEWMQLEGIGETLARRIVDDRERNGPFTSVNNVQRVPGIGAATLARIRPWLRYSAASGVSPAESP